MHKTTDGGGDTARRTGERRTLGLLSGRRRTVSTWISLFAIYIHTHTHGHTYVSLSVSARTASCSRFAFSMSMPPSSRYQLEASVEKNREKKEEGEDEEGRRVFCRFCYKAGSMNERVRRRRIYVLVGSCGLKNRRRRR